eukprot:1102376-Amphidinium_carterae.1
MKNKEVVEEGGLQLAFRHHADMYRVSGPCPQLTEADSLGYFKPTPSRPPGCASERLVDGMNHVPCGCALSCLECQISVVQYHGVGLVVRLG